MSIHVKKNLTIFRFSIMLVCCMGYSTAGYGEGSLDYTKSVSPGPLDLGFDYHIGVPQNHDDKLGIYIENDLWTEK